MARASKKKRKRERKTRDKEGERRSRKKKEFGALNLIFWLNLLFVACLLHYVLQPHSTAVLSFSSTLSFSSSFFEKGILFPFGNKEQTLKEFFCSLFARWKWTFLFLLLGFLRRYVLQPHSTCS